MNPLMLVGHQPLSTWFLCQCIGLILVAFGSTWLNHRRHRDWKVMPDIGVWALLGGLLGGHTAYALTHREDFTHIFRVLDPGSVSSGVLAGLLLVLFCYAKIHQMPMLRLCDSVAPFAALSEAIGHIGCFLAGCCYGKPSRLPWAVSFPPHSYAFHDHLHHGWIAETALRSLPVHPLQLYNAGIFIFVSLIVLVVVMRACRPGTATLVYLFFHGGVRFFIQFLRGSHDQLILGLRTPQLVSLGLCVVVASMLAYRLYENKNIKPCLTTEE